MKHLNEYRQLRDSARARAVPALAAVFTIATPKHWDALFETVSRVPVCEAAAALRHVYAPSIPKPGRIAVLQFLCLSKKVWELESEACPLPVHRGCRMD